MSLRTRYVQQGSTWVPEHYVRPRGLGDVVSRVASAFGIRSSAGCGCASRQTWLNRAVPFRRPSRYVPYGRGRRLRGDMPIVAGGSTPCTPGTDCFCDCVRGTDRGDGFVNDVCAARATYVSTSAQNPDGAAALLFCEDNEAPTLRANTGLGGGAPYWGPPHDDAGYAGNLGHNSYWNRIYGGTGSQCCGEGNFMAAGTQILGKTCEPFNAPNDPCWGPKVWHPSNLWNVNNVGNPRLFFVEDTTFNAEVAGIQPLTGKRGGGAGAFDGAASLAHRIAPGDTSNGHGFINFPQAANGALPTHGPTPQRELGITMAVGYPNNLFTSGLMHSGTQWKHNEFNGGDGILIFGRGPDINVFPFNGFFFRDTDLADTCPASLAAATGPGGGPIIGAFQCNTDGVLWVAQTSVYLQATDFPLGTWACIQGHYRNAGLVNMEWDIWFTGPAGVRKQVVGIRNFDARNFKVGTDNGIYGWFYDTYANTNSIPGHPENSTETSYRYEDNTIMRAGAPVSASQIGFGAAAAAQSRMLMLIR